MVLYISLCFIVVVLAEPLPGKHAPLEGYEAELEREHALPTSLPNADILKTHNNPLYHKPRPPQHHGAALLAGAGAGAGAPPSYAPPGRAFFTPPLPPEYLNPFADKPTLRGTNTDGSNYLNRRPIPPPSLGPGHERIPIRPPGQETAAPQVPAPPPAPPLPPAGYDTAKKKALNTPSNKPESSEPDPEPHAEQANFTDFVPNSLNIPTISRILSGSNGRKEDIPDVLLRTVTARPDRADPNKTEVFITKETGVTLSDSSREASTESALPVLDHDMSNLDRPLTVDETNTRRNLQYNRNATATTTVGFDLKDPELSTERIHNLANVNSDKKILKSDGKVTVLRHGVKWPFAWNVHIYLATVMFTILAVYSIFKIICYNKFTHLFTQYYFIILHLILVFVCLLRIFYMCYDPYNINNSLPIFLSEILLHVPEIFLSIAFASSILFLLNNSINFKNTCCSFLFRSRTVLTAGCLHLLSCLMFHVFENSRTIYKSQNTERRMLSLTCQALFVLACLTLGLSYLYVYRMLKTVLQKKSHTYIHGFQNLYQAIHINLATALLFILLATLQIYGIFAINIQVNMSKFNWLVWGYQFSLRLIEISIVALISWVISLKVGIVASLQHEKADGNKISGLGLFPCTAGSSNEQFESDYPAICNTNTNLHTYTLRTGKPIYETTGHPQMPADQCCSPQAIEAHRFQLSALAANCDNNSGTENYSGHSSIANAGHSSSTESSNAASSQGVTNHLIKCHQNHYNGIESASDDHYSNCDPAIQTLDDDPVDHEYNVIQYGSNGDFVRDIKAQNYGSNRSHNFKHSFDRISSRNNSNQRKKHRIKNKNPQCTTMGYEAALGHHYHHARVPDEYGAYPETASYHASGIQTLNPARNFCDQNTCGRSRPNHSPAHSMANSSGSQKRGKVANFPDRPKSTDIYGFSEDPNRQYCQNQAQRSFEASYSEPQDQVGQDGSSMLVAQDGFVRFRPIDDAPAHT